jgi:hypothetical protein
MVGKPDRRLATIESTEGQRFATKNPTETALIV